MPGTGAPPIDLARLPLKAALLRLSLPLMASMLLETFFNILNSFWVGHLGTIELAAVNICSFSVWLLFAVSGMVATGTNALVAQQLGARRLHRAAAVARIGLSSAVTLGLALAVLMPAVAVDFLHWQVGNGADIQAAVPVAAVYLRIIFFFAPIFCFNELLSAILRAHGDTRTPFRVYCLGFGLNFILDPIFIFGIGPVAGQGVAGAALASGLSFSCMALVYGAIIFRRPRIWRTVGARPGPLHWLGKILRIGVPPSLSLVFFCLVYMFLIPIVGGFGPAALAALGIGHRVESLAYLICYGLSLASITVVGHNIGAGEWERARQAGWEACRLGTYGMLGAALIIGFGAHHLASIFSEDAQVIELTASYLRLVALSEIPMGLSVILQGVASGAGRPMPTTWLTVICVALRVPLAELLVHRLGFGVTSVWCVISSLTALQGIVTVAAYRFRPSWLGQREFRASVPN